MSGVQPMMQAGTDLPPEAPVKAMEREIADYEEMYLAVAEVYDTLSEGRLSKPEVSAATAIGVIEEEVHRNCPDECQHELDLMERSWPEPQDGTTWLHCAVCQKHVWTVPTRLLA